MVLLDRIKAFFQPQPSPDRALVAAMSEGSALVIQQREHRRETQALKDLIRSQADDDTAKLDAYMEFAGEWVEARMMAGAGPGINAGDLRREAGQTLQRVRERALGLRESQPISAQGAFGDIELALQNVEWRREINLSWLEFSRWGIQQIILIARLYYIKNPLIRRATNIAAAYVFGRGVEVTTEDDDANDVLKDFFERNKVTFGQDALVKSEKRKYYDGNLFWCFFADTQSTGEVNARLIDATEIQEVVNNPDDASKPWLYRRVWVSREFDMRNGVIENKSHEAWYPALGYDPPEKPPKINLLDVHWDRPVLHRKCGEVANWHMGCPMMYPALDWAKEARRLLEACATIRRSLAQISMTLTTKGGQAALANAKQQLQTGVNAQPGNSLWDPNPTAVDASVFASGPGTVLSAFNTAGAGGNPDDVKWYVAFVGQVFGIPPTWLGDMETSNLSTAQTLDRPTEIGFLEKQEAWVEDLTSIAKFVLSASAKAPSGRLSEAKLRRKVTIIEMRRITLPNGNRIYAPIKLNEAGKPAKPDEVAIRVNFPSIREGDLPLLIKAIAEAMTLDNKGGQVVGIDEKVGVRLLFDQLAGAMDLGVDVDELLDKMYPKKISGTPGRPGYDPNRTIKPLPAPIPTAPPIASGGAPQAAPGDPTQAPTPKAVEALGNLLGALQSLQESRTNGHA